MEDQEQYKGMSTIGAKSDDSYQKEADKQLKIACIELALRVNSRSMDGSIEGIKTSESVIKEAQAFYNFITN